MLKELLRNKKFQSIITKFYNGDIVDIVLFGSSVKGKEKPKDIDILLIFNKRVDSNLAYKLRKSLEMLNLKVSITPIVYKDLFNTSFLAREAFINEGYSIINKTTIAKGLGFDSFYLFTYNLKNLNKSDRMKFYYSLYGRNRGKGMLKILNAIKFSENMILVPVERIEEARDYLSSLNIEYKETPVLIPERITKSEIFR